MKIPSSRLAAPGSLRMGPALIFHKRKRFDTKTITQQHHMQMPFCLLNQWKSACFAEEKIILCRFSFSSCACRMKSERVPFYRIRLIIMLQKWVLTFKSEGENLKCDFVRTAELLVLDDSACMTTNAFKRRLLSSTFHGTVYWAAQGNSWFKVYR